MSYRTATPPLKRSKSKRSKMYSRPKKKGKRPKKIIFFAPYRQNETSLFAVAMASFISRKLKEIRRYEFKYLTCDPVSDFCSPFVDPYVHRVVSPNDFSAYLDHCKAIYWFDDYTEYLKHSGCKDRYSPSPYKNYLFGDFTKWDADRMKTSEHYDTVIFPGTQISHRMMSLVSCFSNHAVFTGSYRAMATMRSTIKDDSRIGVVISMCSLNNPTNRFAILDNVERIVSTRDDLFVTLLMDGHSFKNEREVTEKIGLEYSDRCVIVNNFSDYEYLNILRQNDVFVDLNPVNGVGYLMTAALHQGLFVAGFDQPLYREILDDGKYGILFSGEKKEYGYGFDRVVPDWERVFTGLNNRLFKAETISRFLSARNDKPDLLAKLEARLRPFYHMFDYFTNSKIRWCSFAY